MKSPISGKEMKRMSKEDILIFRKEEFPILAHYYLCEESGEEFTDEILDNLNVTQAYNQYRTLYNLPFPDEVRETREKYGVSAIKMAEILGFGVNVYRHYETGEVPSISNARLIQLARDPAEFKKLVQASGVLSGNSLDNTIGKIDELIACQTDFMYAGLPKYLMMGLSNNGRGDNKLLFYADFYHYKQTGYSISGAEYIAIQMGPVPLNFSSIFEYADTQDAVDITCQEFQNGGIGELFTPHPARHSDESVFSPDEMASLKTILEKFRNSTTADIVRISHEEPAWSDNYNEKKKISYHYAFKLIHA